MDTQKLKAENRKITGRKVKSLRAEGIIPGNVFGKDVKSESISVNSDDFEKVYKEAGETGIIEVDLAGKKKPVLVSQVQLHPVSGDILHIDFRQVDLTKKITTMVPLEFIGESPAEKQGLGTVVSSIDEVEVEALPQDLPEKFEIDVSSLENVDDSIKVGEIKYDKNKVTITQDSEQVAVRVEPPQKEEEITPEPVAEGEEAEGDQEAPVEGEDKASVEESQGENK